jgi:5-methylthioadenosine/S-adenosylhomocysteine deaminase
MRPDEFLDSARAGIIEGLRHGVTTFGDTAPVTAPFDAMRELGVRGIAYQEFFGPDPAVVADAMAGIRAHVEALRKSETPLVKVGISPHAPFTVSEPLYRAAAEYARAERLPLATHIAESAAEDDFVRRGAGEFADLLRARGIALGPTARSPVALLERADVLGASALLIHAIRCDADDVQAIARSRSAVVTCPLSNRYFGHGVAPMAAYRAAGVTLGAGSDSLASNSTLDILEESRTALAGVAGATAADQWALATRGGAAALGLSGEIGTLEAGKAADFAVFPCAPSHQPPVPPVRRRAALVVVAGVERVRDGEVIGDVQDTLARAAAATARLREWRLRSTPG